MRISDWSSDVCSSDLIEFLHALDELVGVDEAFHADPGRDGADEIFHLLGTPVVIDVDHAADREAREIVRGREGGVEMLAADIVEIDVYRSEEHTSELQSLMRISYAVFCLKKKKTNTQDTTHPPHTH